MKNKFIQLSTILFLFFTTQVYSNPIDKINFIGLNNTSESSLLALIPFEIGQNYSPDKSDQIIEALFKTKLFENISIIKNGNFLDISIKENPSIKYFEANLNTGSGFSNWLKGEKMHLTSKMLSDQLTENELSIGSIYTKRKLNDFISLLESQYYNVGYYNAQITQNVSIDDQNRAGIELDIIQGNRAKIDSFTISGSDNLKEKNLLKLFKIGEPDMAFMNYFTNKDDFSQSELSRGVDLMTNTYFDSGYLDFKVLNINLSLDDNDEKIFIDIEISEGIQYKIGTLTFNGELETSVLILSVMLLP